MTEQQNQSSDLFNDMGIDPMAKQYIRSMASWAMIIVVVAVIGYVLSILDLFRAKKVSFSRSEGFDMGFAQRLGGSDMFGTFFSIAIGLLVNYFLFRFATQAKSAVDGLDQSGLNKAFGNLKGYFMACSIILIIIFVLLLLAVLVAGARTVA
ncbi:MAG: hypothetical protein EOO01_10215 [Chitinophagaceae bacterium]|nr:MAG: hypothetical protein EOO01_10215 [Chitinophagaceae bacterium]